MTVMVSAGIAAVSAAATNQDDDKNKPDPGAIVVMEAHLKVTSFPII
jgi:hypothetical protein